MVQQTQDHGVTNDDLATPPYARPGRLTVTSGFASLVQLGANNATVSGTLDPAVLAHACGGQATATTTAGASMSTLQQPIPCPKAVSSIGLSAPQAWLVQPDKGSRFYVITCAGLY